MDGLGKPWSLKLPTSSELLSLWGLPVIPNRSCSFIRFFQKKLHLRSLLVGGLEHEFYFSIQWECHHPNWLSLHHFSEGLVETTRAGWAQMFIMEYHLSCQTYPICSLLLFKKGGSAATTRKASLPGSPESLRPVHSSGVPTCFGFKVGSEWKLLRDINGLFWDGIRWFSGSRS
jgi:hypothetical protein